MNVIIRIVIIGFFSSLLGCESPNLVLGRMLNKSSIEQKKSYEITSCQNIASNPEFFGERSSLKNESPEGGFLHYKFICDPYNIFIDQARWNAGYTKGRSKYCEYEEAYRIGKQGEHYNMSNCSSVSETIRKNLKIAHSLGVEWYSLNRNLSDAINTLYELDKKTYDLENINSEFERGDRKNDYLARTKNKEELNYNYQNKSQQNADIAKYTTQLQLNEEKNKEKIAKMPRK
ncbi:DUF2799 domain-containing protein [Pseudomonas sp. F1_0610]|uniref:DUF2799 domain-containing protein n=1 Tax=Pseudomonas sp. F1_0610 TaxID=3114284 RepID=UPI0039C03C78